MLGVGRDLCGSSSPTLLPKQGCLQQAAQDLVQAGLEYLQRRRIHHLPGQPVPVLPHPQTDPSLPAVHRKHRQILRIRNSVTHFFYFINSIPLKQLVVQQAFSSITEGLMRFAVSPKFVNRNINSYSCNIPRQNALFIEQGGKTSQGLIEAGFNPVCKRYCKK